MGIGSSGVVNCANTYLGTANYTVADGYVADRTVIVDGNGPAQLNLNFARDEVLDPRITFSRTSNATRVNAQGLIEYAPHNLLTYSENFDNAVWAKSNATVTANAVVAPDGTTTADKLVEDTANSSHYTNTYTATIGVTYSISFYAKNGGRSKLLVSGFGLLGQGYNPLFDLEALTVSNAPPNATIQDVGNGWRRCSLTVTATGSSGLLIYLYTNSNSYTGDGTSGIYLWGAQLNIGSLQPYYTTSVKNLLGYSQNFEDAAWTKSNSSVLYNLLTYSQEFDNAVWTKTSVTVTANAVVAPDGTLTGDKLISNAGLVGYVYGAASVSFLVGTSYTLSIYAKAGERTNITLLTYGAYFGGGSNKATTFNLSNGTYATASGAISPDAVSMASVGNGWYRCAVTVACTTATTGSPYQIRLSEISGDGTSGIYIWGAQLVQGTNPEEYTVTTSAPAPIQVMGPLGFLGAEKLVESAVNGLHNINQGAPTIGLPMTYSFYAKAGERSKINLGGGGYLGQGFSNVFNLATGTLELNTGNKASITSVGNGWYRCAISFTPSGSAAFNLSILDNSGNSTYTGDGTSGVYIFGAQLSDSASLDPYVYNFGAAPTSSAYYGPRFDYDPVTLAPKGLLIEESRTNLLTYSEQFDNAAWAKTNATITANTVMAPDGTTTGDTVLAVATGGDTGVRYTTTQTSGTVYTASIYAKYTNTRYLVIRNLAIGATLGDQWTFFDLLNGTIGTKPAGVTAVITPVGGGWYRCSVSATTLATIVNNFLDYRLSTTDNAYSVLNTSTINIWGAQLEAGAFPTSYIPTTSASVTRAADNASMTGTNFSSWYNQNEGTVAAEYDVILNTGGPVIFDIGAGGVFGTSAYGVQSNSYIGLLPGLAPVNMQSIVYTTSLTNKIAAGLQTNNSTISVNTVLGTTDTSCNMPASATTLTLGCSQFGGVFGNFLNGHIKSFKYFNKRLINTYLQSLTQ